MERSMQRRFFFAGAALMALAMSVPTSFALEARLNPNTATAEQLAAIPSMDAQLAQDIVAKRPFPTMVEFNALVSQKLSLEQASKLYEQLFVPINLNTGTPDEIALIPGMSRRMIREFQEYRPYSDIGVFNREIGK
jgi:DNA uptake protein ComE-like DNA-binding protein